MKEIDYMILEKISNNDVQISNKHFEIIKRLKSLLYIDYLKGEWVITDQGNEILDEWRNSNI